MFVKHNVIEKAINRMATFSKATRYSLAAVVVLIIGRLCMGNSALIHTIDNIIIGNIAKW